MQSVANTNTMKVRTLPRQGASEIAHQDVRPPGSSQVDQGRQGKQGPTYIHNSEISGRDSSTEEGTSILSLGWELFE